MYSDRNYICLCVVVLWRFSVDDLDTKKTHWNSVPLVGPWGGCRSSKCEEKQWWPKTVTLLAAATDADSATPSLVCCFVMIWVNYCIVSCLYVNGLAPASASICVSVCLWHRALGRRGDGFALRRPRITPQAFLQIVSTGSQLAPAAESQENYCARGVFVCGWRK